MIKKARPKAVIVPEGQLAIEQFKGLEVRKVLHEDEWYFSVVDMVGALTDSSVPRRYWSDLKTKLAKEEGYDELYDDIVQLKMPSSDGKSYATDAANVETMFRIIQSVPSKKAEVVKRWLAKVGYERVLEYQNPDIAIKRAILEYKWKGYDDDWIDKRVQSILARQALTGEWSRRGVHEGQEYAILTNLIQEKTFGYGVNGHRAFKGLKKSHNLRGCLKSWSPSQTAQHESGHGSVDPGFRSFRQTLIILAQTPLQIQPAEGAFHHPTPGQYLESMLLPGSAHQLQIPATRFLGPLHQLAAVGPVGPNHL